MVKGYGGYGVSSSAWGRFLRLGLGDGVLHYVEGLSAGLQGVVLGEYVTHVLHAGLRAFGHKAKHPVGGEVERWQRD